MAFEKRYIPLLVIIVVGIASAFVFLSWTTDGALLQHPNYDMILFGEREVYGGAYVDTLYLIFATIPWTLVALLLSLFGARFLLFINKLVMRGRKQSIESIEPKMSLIRLITRAIVPALFAYSIASVILPYMDQLDVGVYNPIFVPPSEPAKLNPFLATALHQSLLFLPITLVIFIPTWILNDFMVISRIKDTKPGEFSDPVKVGQWVSGLLGGFSMIAFPLTFLNTFFFHQTGPVEWAIMVNRTFDVFLALVSVLVVLLAYTLPVIILYDASKSRIARRMIRIADRSKIDYRKVDMSYLTQKESTGGPDHFTPSQFEEMEDSEKLSSPDYKEIEAGVKLDDDEENDNTESGG